MFNINTLVNDKVAHKEHSSPEIDYIVNSYLSDIISDEEMTYWLKSIFNHGMTTKETIAYTSSIINSGVKIKFDNLDGFIIVNASGIGDHSWL